MKELIVGKEDCSQRLDKYLKRMLPSASTSFLYKMLRKKNILLNHSKASGQELLKINDLIQIYFSDDTFQKFSEGNLHEKKENEYQTAYQKIHNIEILYEDKNIILLNKPSGILTQKAQAKDLSLNEWIIGYLLHNHQIKMEDLSHFTPSVLNRIDRNTSGIVIGGKSLIGSRTISEMLKHRTLHKYYRLFVSGKMDGDGILKGYLKKDNIQNKVSIVNSIKQNKEKDYDEIETHYHVIKSNDTISYIEAQLITGKTHQIRAHFSSIHHPLIGDQKYGNKDENQKWAQLGVHSQLLHSYRLVFPEMKDDLLNLSGKEFCCKEPDVFQKILYSMQ